MVRAIGRVGSDDAYPAKLSAKCADTLLWRMAMWKAPTSILNEIFILTVSFPTGRPVI